MIHRPRHPLALCALVVITIAAQLVANRAHDTRDQVSDSQRTPSIRTVPQPI
jgi:hypothetical protein